MNQLTISDYIPKSVFDFQRIRIKNYRNIKDEYILDVSKEFNLLFSVRDDWHYLEDVENGIEIIKGNHCFDELNDFPFFSNYKDMIASIDFTNAVTKQKMTLGSRKVYRHQYNRYGSISIKKNTKIEQLNQEQYKLKYFNEINSIISYPGDFKVNAPINSNIIDEVFKEYQWIDQEKYLRDIKLLLVHIPGHYLVDGQIMAHENARTYDKEVIRLLLFVALEKQLKSGLVHISRFANTGYIYHENLVAFVNLLLEVDAKVLFTYMTYEGGEWELNEALNKTNLGQAKTWSSNTIKMDHTPDDRPHDLLVRTRQLMQREELPVFDDGRFDNDPFIIRDHWKSKEKIAIQIAKDALKQAKRPVIGCSFGKDSMVLLNVVMKAYYELQFEGEIPEDAAPPAVMYVRSMPYPEHYKFVKEQAKIIKEIGWEYIEVVPKTKFKDIVKTSGFPLFGKSIRPGDNPKLHAKIKELGIKHCGNTCCELMKHGPAEEKYAEIGADYIFVGLMASESYQRRNLYNRNGDIYYTKGTKLFKVNPLNHYNVESIWEHINTKVLPYSPIYDMGYYKLDPETGLENYVPYERVGCWGCAMSVLQAGDANPLTILRHTHPKLWMYLMSDLGLAKELEKFKSGIPEEKWDDKQDDFIKFILKNKQCRFDRLE